MTTYEARLEGAVQLIEAESLENAIAQTEEWVRDGSWDTSGGTLWVNATLIETDADGETSHRVKVQIDPEEPPCIDGGEHYWQAPHEIVGGLKENPGVWAEPGGVVIHEVCLRCGCGKIKDTWAQDHETGEQGLTSVSYQPDKYAVSVATEDE